MINIILGLALLLLGISLVLILSFNKQLTIGVIIIFHVSLAAQWEGKSLIIYTSI